MNKTQRDTRQQTFLYLFLSLNLNLNLNLSLSNETNEINEINEINMKTGSRFEFTEGGEK